MRQLLDISFARSWGRDFVLLLIVTLAFSTGFNGLVPALPLLATFYNASDAQIGFFVGAYGIVALVLRPISGRLTDQWGAKRVVLAGCFCFLVGTLPMGFTGNFLILMVLRLFQSMGLILFFTSSNTLGINLVPLSQVGLAIGVMGLVTGLSAIVGPPLVVEIANSLGFLWAFVTLGALGGIALVFTIAVSKSKVSSMPARGRLPLVNRKAMYPSLVFLSFTITQGPIFAFIPLFSLQRDLGNPGIFLAAMGLSTTIARPVAGWAADRFGRAVVVLPGLAFATAGMFLISFSTSTTLFIIAGLVYGVAMANGYVGLLSVTLDRVPQEERGSAVATFQWAWDIGSSFGAMASGALAAFMSYASLFAIAGVFPILGILGFYWRLMDRKAATVPENGVKTEWKT